MGNFYQFLAAYEGDVKPLVVHDASLEMADDDVVDGVAVVADGGDGVDFDEEDIDVSLIAGLVHR